jgi:putative transposase
LTELIVEVHQRSRGAYGALRVRAELRLGREIVVGHNAVVLLMRRRCHRPAQVAAMPSPTRSAPTWSTAPSPGPSRTSLGHPISPSTPPETARSPARGCWTALPGGWSGWSIDASPTAALVTNALGMAIQTRTPPTGAIIHSDQGLQFASWAFTQRAKDSGLVPSMASVGDCYDDAMVEAFWSPMQIELVDRQRWHTRVELADAIFEYPELFHNRSRRHSALGMLTPLELEQAFTVHEFPAIQLHETRGTAQPSRNPGRFTPPGSSTGVSAPRRPG